MQRPVDGTVDKDTEKNMVQTEADHKLGKHFTRRKVRTRVNSGTCEVCSAPCSSCNHTKLVHMGSKADDFSYETYCDSVNKLDVLPFENKASANLHHTNSEASNLCSANSYHDSSSENAENKVNIRLLDVADASVELKMHPKSSPSEIVAEDQLSPKPKCTSSQKALMDKHEDPRSVEVHDDNVSCVSRADDMGITGSCDHKNTKNISSSKNLDARLGSEGSIEAQDQKSDLPQVSSDNAHAGSSLPKIQAWNGVDNSSKRKMKVETEFDNNCGNLQTERCTISNQHEQHEKSNELVEPVGTQECTLQSVSTDDSEESEMFEQDVKVCDICGDTGQEDKLAICSRCTDGAEHTYCMRERRQKVPEGYWLCEDCQEAEDNENQKQDAVGRQPSNTSARSSGKRPAEMVDEAPASKRRVVETSLTSPVSSPRRAEMVDEAPASKRRVVETSLTSPVSSPRRAGALSREVSFKSLKGKMKPAHQTSFGKNSSNDSSDVSRSTSIDSQHLDAKSTLLKSNSFNSLSAKPKVKLADNTSLKHKSSKETSAFSRSMSMKSTHTSRFGGVDSKVKMLSSKFSGTQDMRRSKQATDVNAFERKNLSKLDRSMSSNKVDQKPTPRSETVAVSSPRNNRESMACHSEGKLAALSKSTSTITWKVEENAVNSVRASSVNGTSKVEQISHQVSPKDEPCSNPGPAEWQIDIEKLQDCVVKKRELSSQDEKNRESSGSRLKSLGTAKPNDVTCQKCKEIGHATQYCSVHSPRASGSDKSTVRSHRDEGFKDSKLKAAIEAAILKNPGICRKRNENNAADMMNTPNADGRSEIASQNQLSNNVKSVPSGEGTNEGQVNSGDLSDSYKQTNKQISKSVLPLRTKTSDSTYSSVEKPNASTVIHVLMKASAIPEHNYIWQGSFELHRGGKFAALHFGIQAHLSMCASPKVSEVVNKFPPRIPFDEVPRVSIWPKQFHDNGAKEDNIALFFFARDLISFEKSYKILLEGMMKKDMALRGSFDGVELLIFPSTLLPENSQSWNMLFFLWGVFRARKLNCSDSPKDLATHGLNVASANEDAVQVSLPDNVSQDPMDKETSVHDGCGVAPSSNAADKSSLHGDSDKKVTVPLRPSDQNKCESKVEEKCPSREKAGVDPGINPSALATGMKCGSHGLKEEQMDVNDSVVKQEASASMVSFLAKPDLDAREESVGDEKKVEVDGVHVKVKVDLNEINVDMEAEVASEGLATEVENSGQLTQRNRPCIDLSETAPEASSGTSPKSCWIKSDGNKQKTVVEEVLTVRDGKFFAESSASNSSDLGSSFSTSDKGNERAAQKKVLLDLESNERFFFPVDSEDINDVQFGGSSSAPWKQFSMNIEDHPRDKVPNLDLALGGERKSPEKGILPFFTGNNDLNKPPQDDASTEVEDGMSASLSLSLSFPFPEKEQRSKTTVAKSEQNLSDRHRVNSPFVLFGGLSDK